MMGIVLLIAAVAITGFVTGMAQASYMDRDMWRNDGYCPTCDRLTTEQETALPAPTKETPCTAPDLSS